MTTLENSLRNIIVKHGYETAIKTVGFKNLIKILYNNIYEFYVDNKIKPYILRDSSLMIEDRFIQYLDLQDDWYNQKKLGEFTWISGGHKYRFTARLQPLKIMGNVTHWKVVGTCGDFGFGYSYISKKNTIGNRGRQQIFKQIIEKYNLDCNKQIGITSNIHLI
jgi:hypothetical protein